MSPAESAFNNACNNLEGSVKSQMFGVPCFKIGTKAYVCFSADTMIFKLSGDALNEALSLDGAKQFDPSGKNRPMKEWIQLPYAYHTLWPKFAKLAIDYVSQLK